QGPSGGGAAPRARRGARRFDARRLHDVDTHPGEPAARARAAAARSGAAGSGREDAFQLVRLRDLELVVATFLRRLVRPPAQERGGAAQAIALQVVVLHLTDALRSPRLPRHLPARA